MRAPSSLPPSLSSPFSDPAGVARYAEGTVRKVPGLRDLQTMAGLLLAERVPTDGSVLVLGAGGGLELKAFAEMQPSWRFCGVDPSAEMLSLAGRMLEGLASRVELIHGYIDSAPDGPFDGATCLLTLHFLDEQERRRTLAELHRRLKPGAPFILAHHSAPADGGGKEKWLARSVMFAAASGASACDPASSAKAMSERLPLLPPEREEELLREAGFVDAALFYAGFSFRGWVCRKG